MSSSTIIDSSIHHLQQHPAKRVPLRITASNMANPPPGTDPALLSNFNQWLALGPSAFPADWSGYLKLVEIGDTMASPADWTITLDPFKNPDKSCPGWSDATPEQRGKAQKPYLDRFLPERKGPRSRAKHFVFPQREHDADVPHNEEVKKAYLAAYNKLAEPYTESTVWGISELEKREPALFLLPSLPLSPIAASNKREICHMHSSDLSAHVTLSFADAEQVILKGWGERHRLSGTDWIPLGYTLLYVPRDVQEVEVLKSILEAGIKFMTSG